MPALSSIKSPVKALILGSSGSGKTGSLWSLAHAGFNVRIFDLDRGTGVLSSALEPYQEALDNIQVCTFTNALKGNKQGFVVPIGTPKAWPDFLSALNEWPDSPREGIQSWGPDTVAVIDSGTLLGRHALLYAQHLEGKTGKQPELQHYGTAMAQLEGVLATLYSDHVSCHVLVMTHITNVTDNLGVAIGMPSFLGEKLPPIAPRYFNTMLVVQATGGARAKRHLSTRPTSMVQTKVEAFAKVKDTYLLADGAESKPGMAEFFADCGWPGPNGASR